MIPKKIYLTNKELQDTTTCERMVSIGEPYREMTEEYVNLSQVWHNINEEPQGKYEILVQDEFGHFWLTDHVEDISHYQNGWKECAAIECIIRWAYISDLLP